MRDERKRTENERKFTAWDELPDGGRRYFFEVAGHHGWSALCQGGGCFRRDDEVLSRDL